MSNLTITTEVTADTSAATLDVKDHGHSISVPQETDQTTLVWTLTGAGPNSAFNSIDLNDPETSGFSWVGGSTPPGFGTPSLVAHGNQITMTDDNINSGTAGGPYIYQLRATVDGVACATTSSVSPRGTVTDPSIVNK
ncbi:MAG TPA: hypothetical protein VF022_03240 [Rhodanobacteraceae bacterium]|jgi:hypothetical protein